MKAISPMVAVILLIAFTIAIGGIISVWFTGLVRITGGPAEAAAEKVSKCAAAWISVDEVNATANRVIASNPSTLDITKVTIVLDGTTVSPSDTELKAGQTKKYDVTIGGNTTVIVKGLCLGEVPKEGKCSTGDVCWKI
jgi:flagellin-like protein